MFSAPLQMPSGMYQTHLLLVIYRYIDKDSHWLPFKQIQIKDEPPNRLVQDLMLQSTPRRLKSFLPSDLPTRF
jgi:hypothetical protein